MSVPAATILVAVILVAWGTATLARFERAKRTAPTQRRGTDPGQGLSVFASGLPSHGRGTDRQTILSHTKDPLTPARAMMPGRETEADR